MRANASENTISTTTTADLQSLSWGLGCLGLIALAVLVVLWGAGQQQVVLGLSILGVAVMLSSFPWFLQLSFEQIKKERICGDIWTDLMYLGYWINLKHSAEANKKTNIGKTINNDGGQPGLSQSLQAISALGNAVSTPFMKKETAEQPADDIESEALREFNKRIEEHYGTRAFILPLANITALYLIGWFSLLFPKGLSSATATLYADGFAAYVNGLVSPQLSTLSAAFLGAYLISMQGLFRRYIRSDFKPAAITQAGLRLLIAWIVAFLALILTTNGMVALDIPGTPTASALPALGFVAGIFPWEVLGWLLESLAKNVPVIKSWVSGLGNAELTELDGLDVWDKDRLDEAGINYVVGLANADLMDLLIAVRMPTELLVDWVDQAILRAHLYKGTYKIMQSYTPIRNATDLLDLVSEANGQAKLADLIRTLASADEPAASKPADKYVTCIEETLDILLATLKQDANIENIKMYRKWKAKTSDELPPSFAS